MHPKVHPKRAKSLLETMDLPLALTRAAALCGLRLAPAALARAVALGRPPPSLGEVVRWVEADVESLGPLRRDMGSLGSARGWLALQQARALPAGSVRLGLLKRAEVELAALHHAEPNDWSVFFPFSPL